MSAALSPSLPAHQTIRRAQFSFRRTVALGLAALLAATGVGLTVATSAKAVEPVTGQIGGALFVENVDLGWVNVGENDVLVTAWRYNEDPVTGAVSAVPEATALSDINGQWAFVGLPVGSYEFEYDYLGALPNIVNSVSSDVNSVDEALYNYVNGVPGSGAFLPFAADETGYYSDPLYIGGVISGTVSSQFDSSPLAGQPVEVWRHTDVLDGSVWVPMGNGEGGTIGHTSEAGTYSFAGLPGGNYTMRVGGAGGYIAEFWSDIYAGTPAEGDQFTIFTGESVTLDFALEGGPKVSRGSISVESVEFGLVAAGENDVLVTAWRFNEDPQTGEVSAVSEATTLTDVNGAWEFVDLPVGNYEFEYDYRGALPNIVDSVSSEANSIDEALYNYVNGVPGYGAFPPFAADETGSYTASLYLGGVISGTVFAQFNSSPLAGQPVEVWRQTEVLDGSVWVPMGNGEGGTIGHTGGAGTYSFVGLPSGQYTIRVGGAGGYIAEFWSDIYAGTPAEGDQFSIIIGESVTRDFSLVGGSKVSGTVKTSTGTVLPGIEVSAHTGSFWSGYQEVARTTTSSTGKYTLNGLPAGNYIIEFASPYNATTQYLTEYWNNATRIQNGTPITVTAGANRTAIDAALARAASISGTVSLAGGVGDLDFTVEACSRDSSSSFYVSCNVGSVTYGSGGTFKVSSLPPGSYTVRVNYTGLSNFRSEYLSNVHVIQSWGEPTGATFFTLLAGTAATGKNVVLDPGAQITGTVTLNGAPKEDAYVAAVLTSDTDTYPSEVRSVRTAADGSYTIKGLEFTGYQIKSYVYDGSASTQWFQHEYSRERAESISFDGPTTSTGNDFALESSSTISGTVLGFDPLGGPNVAVQGYTVTAYRYLDAGSRRYLEVAETSTGADGGYTFSGLPPGEYIIEIRENYTAETGYLTQFVGGVPGQSAASVARIPLDAGESLTRDTILTWGGSYTGRVVDSEGNGLASVGVQVSEDSNSDGDSTTTAEDGSFTLVGLSEGAHEIRLDTYEIDTIGAKYGDKRVQAPAVTINSGPVVVPEIQLELSSTISGVVLGVNGKVPAANTNVYAYARSADEDWTWNYVSSARANASGGFTLDDIPTGTVYLWFGFGREHRYTTPYPGQYLGGSSVMELSTPVIVTTPGSTIFREARLVTGGSITGVVTNKATGRALSGIGIQADGEDGSKRGAASTNSSGAYIMPGLEAGAYDMTFNLRSSGNPIGLSYGNDLRTVYVPDLVTVKANSALIPAVKVSGTVRAGSLGLGGVNVTAYPYRSGIIDYNDPYLFDSSTVTNSAGNYSLMLEQGTWVVRFSDPLGRVAEAWLGGAADVASSTPVVASSAALTGRNITLAPATGAIAATVQDSTGSVPKGWVDVYRADGTRLFDDPYDDPYWRSYGSVSSFDEIFPLTNVPGGTYRIVLTRRDECVTNNCAEVTSAPPIEFTDVVVSDGVVDLNSGAPIVFAETLSEDSPQVTAGAGPQLSITTVTVGDTLTTSTGTWVPAPDTFEYQWLRNGVAIRGATGDSYVAGPGDAGKTISVSVIGLGDQDYGYSAESNATDPILAGAAANPLTAPTISGRPVVGQTLVPQPGTWDLPKLNFTYRWVRSTLTLPDVTVSTSSSYKPTTADVYTPTTGATLALTVTATRAGFVPATITVPVDQIQPAIAMKQTIPSVVSTISGGLRVTSGTWSPTGALISYEWRRYAPDGTYTSFVTGTGVGTSSNFTDPATMTSTDRIVVRVTATRAGYTPTTVTLLARKGAPVLITDAPQLGAGPIQVGLPLAVNPGAAVTLPTGAIWTYQWLRGSASITGATKASYTPAVTDVGATLSVRATASVSGYTSSTTVIPVGVVLAAGLFDANVDISGVPSVGRVLSAVTTTWSPAPTTKTYKWTRNGIAISKSTLSTYTLTASDLGTTIGVTVTGSRVGFATTVRSATVATPITALELQNINAPTIGSKASVGVKLAATPGTWDLAPTSYGYQWLLNGVPIKGAIASTYTPIIANVDEEISVLVTARRTGIPSSAGIQSASLTVEPGAAVKASALPLLTVSAKTATTAKLNALVIATAGTWPVAALNLRYQWQVNRGDGSGFVNLDGATTKQLRLDPTVPANFATNYLYRVVVSATRTGYLASPDAVSASLKLIP